MAEQQPVNFNQKVLRRIVYDAKKEIPTLVLEVLECGHVGRIYSSPQGANIPSLAMTRVCEDCKVRSARRRS